MKRNAVLGHTLAIALTTAAAGVALCAGPASADETSRIGLAPLPEVLAGASLFGQKGESKGESKGEEKGEEEEGGGGGKECRSDWINHHVHLRLHPVGYVRPKGFTLTDLVPNHPSGFPNKGYNNYELTYGMGGGTQIGISAVGAREFGTKYAPQNPHGTRTDWFWGGYLQKRLLTERGMLPTLSLGIRGNVGDHSHDTLVPYLVGTKKVLGKPCGVSGVYLTSGVKYERFSTNYPLDLITPISRPVPPFRGDAVAPFEGINIAATKNIFLSAEWAPKLVWEFQDEWALKGELLVWRGWGVEGGWESNGYHTRTFVALEIGSIGPITGGGHHR